MTKTTEAPNVTTNDAKLKPLVDDVNFDKERPWFHAYPEDEDCSPNSEFDNYLIVYKLFMSVAKWLLVATCAGLIVYSVL